MVRARAFGFLVPAVVLVLLVLFLPVRVNATGKRISDLRRIDRFRHTTWYWQGVMGIVRTPTEYRERRVPSENYRRWVLDLWKRRAQRIEERSARVPHRAQWLCIHRGEAAWNANTGNGYYGGLQMDITFQRMYGSYLLRRYGTADRWSPDEQMWVAEHAFRSGRGFYPWPNTARACGLI